MLRVHLPKPTKHRTKEALLSLKDFSVQIIFLFAAKVTLKPVSPPLLRDAASSLHRWRGPWAGARFFLPSPVSELNNPSRWQQAGCPRGCHRQRLDIVPAGPSAVVVQAGSWHWESLAALLYQKAPYLPLFVAAVASQKLTLIPRKHICHFKSVSPRDVLLYRNNLFAFLQLSRLLYAAWGKKPSTFPFQILISLSGAFCKNSPRGRCFYCCCIFLSCHFIPNKMQVPPVPPVLTSGQHFLPFLITISLTCYDSTQNHWH